MRCLILSASRYHIKISRPSECVCVCVWCCSTNLIDDLNKNSICVSNPEERRHCILTVKQLITDLTLTHQSNRRLMLISDLADFPPHKYLHITGLVIWRCSRCVGRAAAAGLGRLSDSYEASIAKSAQALVGYCESFRLKMSTKWH